MNVTALLAEKIISSQPDEQARQEARDGVCDFIAVCWPLMHQQVPDSGLPILKQVYPEQTIAQRALLLGYAGHALDYDDFHADFRGHPTTVILPALIAWCSFQPSYSADEFLDAYIIGVEVAGRLGLAATQQHYTRGFHNTATLGTLAAAAALARLSRASLTQTQVLLGIAATEASGLRAQFGSAVKPLHAGLAAERAVRATQLALAGFDGQPQGVIEAFLSATSHEAVTEKLTADWGAPWRITQPGLEFKPFATCSGTHSAAEAARIIRRQWVSEQGSVHSLLALTDEITVAFPPGGDIAASVRHPHSGIEARFSLEYVIAAMLLYDDLRMVDFAEGPVNPEVMALAGKVRRIPDENAPPDAINPALRFHEVCLLLSDGRQLNCRRTRQESLAEPVNVQEKLWLALAQEPTDHRQQVADDCRLTDSRQLRRLIDALLA